MSDTSELVCLTGVCLHGRMVLHGMFHSISVSSNAIYISNENICVRLYLFLVEVAF